MLPTSRCKNTMLVEIRPVCLCSAYCILCKHPRCDQIILKEVLRTSADKRTNYVVDHEFRHNIVKVAVDPLNTLAIKIEQLSAI